MKASDPRRFEMANALRVLALDAVKAANSGHSGMPMGMADVTTVLFDKFLKFDASNPAWPDRDRFVLSAGHGSMLLYGVLHLTGTPGMDIDQLRNFRQLGAATAGHPEAGHAPGIETTTGPLGQGLATAVGMAIAEEALRARFGKKIVDHKTWVIAGDGCLMEGVSHEAIGLAGHQQLSNLIVLWDDNGITIDGPVSLSDRTDQKARFAAAGWDVFDCDGHNTADIEKALAAAIASKRPAMVACKTRIGIGSSAEGTSKAHGALTADDLIADARKTYGWSHPPFDIPGSVKSDWETAGSRGAADHLAWMGRVAGLSEAKQKELARLFCGDMPDRLASRIRALKKQISADAPKIATRNASQNALEVINTVLPETIGGSADLTGSNNTKTSELGIFSPDDRKGRHIHYGIREHGMAAAMNGMAFARRGPALWRHVSCALPIMPAGAMRLSSLMNQKVVYVMTHDSIGLGEDGPTHQPVEHLALLRATPNLRVFRPADAVETAEAWELALTGDGPSVLALTRQGVPTVRTKHASKNLTAQGAYILAEADGKRRAILIATGSEISVAMDAKALLKADGIGTRVVSMPCWEVFAEQPESYRKRVLPAGPVRVGVEAAVRHGWDQWLMGERGSWKKADFVGMDSFGASAPAGVLFDHFGITPEAVASKVKALL